MDYYSIPAGREMDELVAEKVMGFREVEVPADIDGGNSGRVLVPPSLHMSNFKFPNRGPIPRSYLCPNYSTHIEEAWKVVDRIMESGAGWDVNFRSVYPSWVSSQHNPITLYDFTFESRQERSFKKSAMRETFTLAICTAALELVEEYNRRYPLFKRQPSLLDYA